MRGIPQCGAALIFALNFATVVNAEPPVPHRIRVRISHSDQVLNLRAANIELEASNGQIRRIDGMQRLQIGCGGGRVYVFVGDTQYIFPSWVSLQAPGFLFLGAKPYREEFRVHAVGKGCDLVNVVDVERYLAGLVNSEFSTKWSGEAVAAQVIAARTYAYYQMSEARRRGKAVFDLESTVKDQVYEGSLGEDDVGDRIVAETRGQILNVARGLQPIKAFYHSTCGGRTANPDAVMGQGSAKYTQSVPCPFCKSSPAFEWSLELPESEIRKAVWDGISRDGAPLGWPLRKLSELKSWFQKGQIAGMTVRGRDTTGRINDVVLDVIHGNGRQNLTVSGVMLRRWLGPGLLKSTAFGLAKTGALAFRFVGRGNGHGVGMCQWGAKEMGGMGYSRVAILKHYYPSAVVRKLW